MSTGTLAVTEASDVAAFFGDVIKLFVEDGTLVAGANSYNTLAEIRAYAIKRGRVISTDDDTIIAYAIRAMDYLESFRGRYKGSLIAVTQALAFPRHGVKADGITYADTDMPLLIKSAQCQLVIDINGGLDLQPTFDRSLSERIKRNKIGPLDKEFFDDQPLPPQLTAVISMLDPLLRSAMALSTLRI